MRTLIAFFIGLQLLCSAAPPAVEQQARQLQSILRQADDAYYNQGQPLMSDAAYDALRDQHNKLVARYPELAAAESVGATPAEGRIKIEHSTPILSLEKAYSDGDVSAFLETCGTNLLYCVEPKIDGATVVLRYSAGVLRQAITRGDGNIGVDITAAIIASGAVPVVLTNAPPHLEVRGEAVMPVAEFELLNQRREAAGQPALKSPRNTAAGTLNLKDYAEVARRGLHIQIFELLQTDVMPPTHTAALAWIASLGLPTIESRTVAADEVIPAIAVLNRRRSELPYQTDGIVVRMDDRSAFAAMGSTAHHPRGALARKYKEVPRETRLLGVDWTRGETGKQTPVARFEPVEINGATVQQATLHNLEHLRAMDLQIGDTIEVIRAGGTVPEIVGVRSEKRTGRETPIPDPEL